MRKYRCIEIFEYPEDDPEDRYNYWAECLGHQLRSATIRGIESQIGRVLNGLQPCDCGICECRIPASPLGPPACSRGGPAMSREAMGWYCCPYFKPDLRRAL